MVRNKVKCKNTNTADFDELVYQFGFLIDYRSFGNADISGVCIRGLVSSLVEYRRQSFDSITCKGYPPKVLVQLHFRWVKSK